MTRLAKALQAHGYSHDNLLEFPHVDRFYRSERGRDMLGEGRAFTSLPLSAFKSRATAYVNFIAGQYWVRIRTDADWYVEPPPSDSLMEAIHHVKVWAGNQYEVDVVTDLQNASLKKVGQHERERQLHGDQ